MSPSPRILVAEDDNDIREIVRTRLKMAGFDVRVARNGMEALNSVMVVKLDAMVLDIATCRSWTGSACSRRWKPQRSARRRPWF